MRMTPSLPLLLAAALSIPAGAPLALPTAAGAQVPEPPRADGSSILTYAKWGALGGAVAAGVVGFIAHSDADGLFDDLEAACEEDPARCAVAADGSYVDPALESRFREVLKADSRTRTALILSQVAAAAAVAMFLLDLGGDPGPDNVPYDPDRGFGFRNGADGRSEVVYVVPWGRF